MSTLAIPANRTPVSVGVSFCTKDANIKEEFLAYVKPHLGIDPTYDYDLWDSEQSLPGLPANQFKTELEARPVMMILISPNWAMSEPVRTIELLIAESKIRIPVGLRRVDLPTGVFPGQMILYKNKFFEESPNTAFKQQFALHVSKVMRQRLDREGWHTR
ncbi:MAG: hypothetical protein LBJ08_00405 [Bifidobacteriaceae bacterium]|jgi:hypothetical protein|nr:hypothetical protein [Bifidobacteriaceae bacterium]